jgi:hypothetical protein
VWLIVVAVVFSINYSVSVFDAFNSSKKREKIERINFCVNLDFCGDVEVKLVEDGLK